MNVLTDKYGQPIRIHLKSRGGVYMVVRKNSKAKTLLITCKRWNALKNWPDNLVTKTVRYSDFQSMAGNPGDKKRRKIAMDEFKKEMGSALIKLKLNNS